ncbi:MAG: aldo/keto reductase [Candidatus Thorarchaeota archaeon]
MTNLIDHGQVHYWGTSMWPPHLVERTISIAKENGYIAPSVEEPPYHMMARFIEVDLIPVAKYHGLGLTTFEALATGLFTGKYMNDTPIGSRNDTFQKFPEEVTERYARILPGLKDLADSIGIGMNHLAIAWTLRLPEISSSIMGARLPEQVRSNVEATDVILSNETLERIEEILANKPRIFYSQ